MNSTASASFEGARLDDPTAMERALKTRGVTVKPVLEIGSREGVWKAVEQGPGIGYVADLEFVAHPKLKTVRIRDANLRCPSSRPFPDSRRLFSSMSHFLMIRKRLKSVRITWQPIILANRRRPSVGFFW